MSEHQEQTALIAWATLAARVYPALRLLFAIPNGGARDAVTGALLKAEGVRPGVPDLCLPVARHGYHGLYIEMKDRGGKVSRAQRVWMTDLAAEGYRVEVCYGWEQARETLESYLEGTL